MKDRIWYFCVLIILCVCTTGCAHRQQNKDFDASLYDTPYTYVNKTEDGKYELYIYSSPVQFADNGQYKKIDNTLIASNSDKYLYENKSNSIKTYFPEKLDEGFCISDEGDDMCFYIETMENSENASIVNYRNLYGDIKEAVHYKSGETDIYVYPINTGIHFEYVFELNDELTHIPILQADLENVSVDNFVNEYVQFIRKNKKNIIVNEPASMNEQDGLINIANKWEMDKNDLFIMKPKFKQLDSEGKMHVEFSIQVHQEDIPDTSAYENKEENVYLSNYAAVGRNTDFGEAWYYMRYKIYYFFSINKSEVLNAEYYLRNLNYQNNQSSVIMYSPLSQWSSTRMVWEDKTDYLQEPVIASGNDVQNGWISFNITDFVKEQVDEGKGVDETFGALLMSEDEKAVLATSDNGEFIPYLKIVLSKLPDKFNNHISVNDDDMVGGGFLEKIFK